jgi:hypothetical protein
MRKSYKNPYSLIRSSHNTISLDVVYPELKKLFLKCFNDGHTQPHLRPTAENWHNALKVAVNQLIVCRKIDSHHYSRHYGECNWCQREKILGVDIFPSRQRTISSFQRFQNSTSSNQTSKKSASQTRQPSSPPKVPFQYRFQIILTFQRFQNSISFIQTWLDSFWLECFVVGAVVFTFLSFFLGWDAIMTALIIGIGLILCVYTFCYYIGQGIKLVSWIIREITTKIIIYRSLFRSRKKINELIRKLIKFLKNFFP